MTTLASVVIQSTDMRFCSVFSPYISPVDKQPGYAVSFPVGIMPVAIEMHLPRAVAAANDPSQKYPGYVTARSKRPPMIVEMNKRESKLALVVAEASDSRIPMDYLLTGTPVGVLIDVWENTGGNPHLRSPERYDLARMTIRTVGVDAEALADRLEQIREIIRLDLAERFVFQQTHPTARGWPLWVDGGTDDDAA